MFDKVPCQQCRHCSQPVAEGREAKGFWILPRLASRWFIKALVQKRAKTNAVTFTSPKRVSSASFTKFGVRPTSVLP